MTRDDVERIVAEARDGGQIPDLSCADLSSCNLTGADLRGADLRGADLRDANLWCADLSGADLSGADLRGADLRDADLWCADLRDANLWCADLSGAHLAGALWDGLAIDNAHPYRCLLAPTPDGWVVRIGCWAGTLDQLQELIDGDDWPEAKGEEIDRRRPLLQAAIHLMRAHIESKPDVIGQLKDKWSSE